MILFPKFKNKYLKVPLLYSGSGGSDWRQHLQPCEYLQADRNSIINVNVNLNDCTYFKCIFKSNLVDKFAVQSHGDTNAWFDLLSSSSTYAARVFNKTPYLSSITKGVKVTCLIDISNRKIYFNNTSIDLSKTYYKNNNSIRLFGEEVIIYSCECDFFNLIAAYVIDKYIDNKGIECTTGTPGLIDVETGVFYTNDGAGHFTHGEDINL